MDPALLPEVRVSSSLKSGHQRDALQEREDPTALGGTTKHTALRCDVGATPDQRANGGIAVLPMSTAESQKAPERILGEQMEVRERVRVPQRNKNP